MEAIKQLIEDYERKLVYISSALDRIRHEPEKYLTAIHRHVTKREAYKTFISELKKINN